MSNITFANLSSTYFYAYMLMQIPSGILADYIGWVIDKYEGLLAPINLYQNAFLYCFAAVVIGFVSIFLVKETNCKNIYE